MKKIVWCVIGAGGIADRRGIPALLSDPHNEVAAVMDRVVDVAETVAKKYHIPAFYGDAEEMLKSTKFDAVYIASPVFCHYEQAMLALKYGVNVFMEKPLAMNAKEGKQIVDAFIEAGKQLTVGYMMGYHNLHRQARQLIADGKLGTVNLVRMQFSCWYPEIPGAWRQNPALSGGGCIMDLAVHCMELFGSITGDEIADCQAYYGTRTFRYPVEDSAVIMFRSKQGVLGHIDVNFNIPDACATSRLEIYGTEGSICAEGTLGQEEVGNMSYVYSPQGSYDAQQSRSVAQSQTFAAEGANIYQKQFAYFNSLIAEGKTCYDNALTALHIQQLCDRIYEG